MRRAGRPLLLLSAGVGLAQTVDTSLWVTNRTVHSVVRDGGTIYIGGGFTYVGPGTGAAVAIDANTGAAHQPYPKVLGYVYAVAPDGSGGWYLGGSFTAVLGQPRSNLAHLDAGGNLTAWAPNANGDVLALEVSGGTVYAGGDFTSVGGQPRNYIAALHAVTGAATAWNPSAMGIVRALAVSGGTVYAGGEFTIIGGQTRNFIAALDAVSSAATTWNPNANNTVFALAVSGGTVYTGGSFTIIGGQPQSGIAVISADQPASVNDAPSRRFPLHGNFPNPCNPSTTIRFDVPPEGARVRLEVFDVTGRLVRTLIDRFVGGGGRSSHAGTGRISSAGA